MAPFEARPAGRRFLIAGALLGVLLPASVPAQLSRRAVADAGPRDFLIRGGTVHIGDGTVLSGASVALSGGLVTAVGPDAAAPPGAWEVDASGKHVYPGFVNALSDLGLPARGERAGAGAPRPGGPGGDQPPPSRGPEDRPDTFSFRYAADSLDPGDDRIAAARSRGFTSAVSVAGSGIVSGHAAWLNLAGEDGRDFVVSSDAAIMVRLETRGFRSFPGSLMGVIAYLKQLFLDVSHDREAWRLYEEDPTGLTRPRYDRTLAPLAAAAAGEQPVLLPANLDKEIRRMVGLAGEMGVRPVVYGGHEAASAAGFLADAGVPILVDLDWPDAGPDRDPEAAVPLRELRLRDEAPAGPAALAAAGVRFAFYGGEGSGRGGPGRSEGGGPLAAVRAAVERGLDPEAAVVALTSAPAEIFGVAGRVGTLGPGKIANLVIADGDLFAGEGGVETVFVDGVIHHVGEGDEATDAGDSRGANR